MIGLKCPEMKPESASSRTYVAVNPSCPTL